MYLYMAVGTLVMLIILALLVGAINKNTNEVIESIDKTIEYIDAIGEMLGEYLDQNKPKDQ